MKYVKALRDVPRTLWITKIMSYLELEECFKLGQVCVYFNQVIKSPIFVKYFVTLKERTRVDVSANHFSIDNNSNRKPKK